jgi:hypothetical protein
VSTEDGLCYSIDCMKLIKELNNSILGKTGRVASLWLGGRSVPTKNELFTFFNKAFSCLFIACIEWIYRIKYS